MEKPYEPTPSTEAAKALDELKSLPSFEETKLQVQAAMGEITAAAGKLIPSITWETPHEGSSGDCRRRPYEQAGAQDYFLPDEVAVGVPVSESEWAQILGAATKAAAKIGATDVKVIHDQPENHDVWFSGPAGIYIKIGYRGNLVVSGYTGCRLPLTKN